MQRCPFSPILYNTIVEVLVNALSPEKEIEIRMKERTLSLFADMVIHVENPKNQKIPKKRTKKGLQQCFRI